MPKQVEVRAHHESGHGVIARVQGVAVNFVTTLAFDDVTAAVADTHSATYLARDADQASQLAAIVKDMVVCLAGPYTQARHRPIKKKHTPDEWESDIKTAANLAAQAALVESGVDVRLIDADVRFTLNADQAAYAAKLFQQCSNTARDLVAEHWPAIAMVANALLSRPILNGDDLDELIAKAVARA